MTSPARQGWSLLRPLLGAAALFGLWWLVALGMSPAILPPPAPVLQQLWSDLGTARLWADTGITLINVLASFLIALALGVALGLLAARLAWLERALHPFMVVIESAPTIAWLVLAILWLGLGAGPAILVGVSMALPLIFISTVHGLKQIDTGLLDMARIFRLSPWTRLTRLLLPSLALTLAGAASGALSVAWRGVIMAEAFSATEGLGPALWGGYLYGEIVPVYATILWIILLGLLLEYLVIHPVRRAVHAQLHL
ncbi:MAG: ABC transporter permease [Halothiobacillaceae bacterium]